MDTPPASVATGFASDMGWRLRQRRKIRSGPQG
jgi:hypothetical protein